MKSNTVMKMLGAVLIVIALVSTVIFLVRAEEGPTCGNEQDCPRTKTPTPTVTATATMTNTPTATATATMTNTPTATATPTSTATDTPTVTPTWTMTPTDTPTSMPIQIIPYFLPYVSNNPYRDPDICDNLFPPCYGMMLR